MKKSILIALAAVTVASVVFTACSKKDETTTPPATPTLYERVGGTTKTKDVANLTNSNASNVGKDIEAGRLTLRSVVDSSILVVAADTQMSKYFGPLFAELGANNTTGLTALSENLTDFFCFATGATNADYKYVGKSMKDAHNPATNNRMGLKANTADFDKFVGDVGKGLAQNGVDGKNADNSANATETALINDLVTLLYTTKADIVQR